MSWIFMRLAKTFSINTIALLSLVLLNCNNAEFSSDEKDKNTLQKDSQSADSQSATAENNTQNSFDNGNNDNSNTNINDQDIGEVLDNGKVIKQNPNGSISETLFGMAGLGEKVEVDVIFAMDTSGSMNDEKKKIEENMDRFLQQFAKRSWVDSRVFMIGGATDPNRLGEVTFGFNFPELDPKQFDQIDQPVKSHDALKQIKRFIEGEISGDLSLRQKSKKEIVVISDEDSDESAGDFVKFLRGLESKYGKFEFNGFVGTSESKETSTCRIAQKGDVYAEVSKRQGGLIQDLCTENWEKMIDSLAEKVINAFSRTDYKLEKLPDLNKEIEVKINGESISQGFWMYDKSKNMIIFKDESTAPYPGDLLEINYWITK